MDTPPIVSPREWEAARLELLVELPRHHRARPPGGGEGLTRGLPPDAALRVVALARRVRRRPTAPEEWLDRIAGSGQSRHHVAAEGGDGS